MYFFCIIILNCVNCTHITLTLWTENRVIRPNQSSPLLRYCSKLLFMCCSFFLLHIIRKYWPFEDRDFFATYSWIHFIMDSIFAPFAQYNLEYKWNSKFMLLKLDYIWLWYVSFCKTHKIWDILIQYILIFFLPEHHIWILFLGSTIRSVSLFPEFLLFLVETNIYWMISNTT